MFRFLKFFGAGITLGLSVFSLSAGARPFDSCPSKAFLVQDNVAKIYGVNLATGYYELLSDDMGTDSKLNAMGYNQFDDYMYAYSFEWKTLVRINANFQAEPLPVSGMPDTSFYVGDIALSENVYYAYRPGSRFGLYKIPLNEESDDYLAGEKIISGEELNIKIFDFAFHPSNGFLYSVDSYGFLHRIDPSSGQSSNLGSVGEVGTFGAVYFDADGQFYISRNQDGFVFRINLSAAAPAAEFFAFGPASSNNDGARCPTANIISDVATVDFGSAPESYGSNIENNGARHEYSEEMYLGDVWGGNEDGAEVITSLERGTDAVISTKVKGEGFINAWADWNQDGQFEASEHVVVDKFVSHGTNLLLMPIPAGANVGDIWTRLRYSSVRGLGPNGGVADGEVEDQKLLVVDTGVSVQSYPSTQGYSTLAFEDNWPEKGDYDMNDAVFAFRTHRFINAENKVIRYDIEGKVLALGAGYHNGFAVMLDGISSGNIDTQKSLLYVNGLQSASTLLEENDQNDDAVFVFFKNLNTFFPASEFCTYYRTQEGCLDFESNHEATFRASISLINGVPEAGAPKGVLNPFIFAAPGRYHGEAFASPPGRSLEIHLKNKATSARFDSDFFGLKDDRSTPGQVTFLTENNLPWALEIPTLWAHPKERQDLTHAYPDFQFYVESSGETSTTWFIKSNSQIEKVVENEW